VPVYNKTPYLPRVLEAIAAQEGDFEREFIFVDDGSTDGSLDLLKRLTADWSRVTIVTQKNRGSGHATNRGIERAAMPFIKFVDADDLLTRRATMLLLDAIQKTGAVLAYGKLASYDAVEEVDLEPSQEGPVEVERAPLRSVIQTSYFNPTQILVATGPAQAVGGCDERIVHSQEYGMALRLARKGAFCRVPATVAWMPREAPGRLSENEGRQLQRVTLATAYFLKDYPETPESLQHYAYRKAAGRAWKWARRRKDEGLGSRWFWRRLLSGVPLGGDYSRRIERCAAVFDGGEERRASIAES
jgi:hypothetical protein